MKMWLPYPYKSRTMLLMAQFAEILTLWRRIGVLPDFSSHYLPVLNHLMTDPRVEISDPTRGLASNLLQIANVFSVSNDLLFDSFAVRNFGVFNRNCFNTFFRVLDEGKIEDLFPARFLCFDFDDVKGLNMLCGGNYQEANKVIAHSLDIGHNILRSHRRSHTIRSAPSRERRTNQNEFLLNLLLDLIFQFQSGDEMALFLGSAKSISECESVGKRLVRALEKDPGVLITTADGSKVMKQARITYTCVEVQFGQSVHQALGQAFETIESRKKQARQERAKRRVS